jgi:hypothetical protein
MCLLIDPLKDRMGDLVWARQESNTCSELAKLGHAVSSEQDEIVKSNFVKADAVAKEFIALLDGSRVVLGGSDGEILRLLLKIPIGEALQVGACSDTVAEDLARAWREFLEVCEIPEGD